MPPTMTSRWHYSLWPLLRVDRLSEGNIIKGISKRVKNSRSTETRSSSEKTALKTEGTTRRSQTQGVDPLSSRLISCLMPTPMTGAFEMEDIRSLAGGILDNMNMKRPPPRSLSGRSADSIGSLLDEMHGSSAQEDGGTVVGTTSATRPAGCDDEAEREQDANAARPSLERYRSDPDMTLGDRKTLRRSSRLLMENSSGHGRDSGSVDVRSIMNDIANPVSDIDAANALLAGAPSLEELKDQLSMANYDNTDDDISLDDNRSLWSKRSSWSINSRRSSNSSRRSSIGSARSYGSRRSYSSRKSIGSRAYGRMVSSGFPTASGLPSIPRKGRKTGQPRLPRVPTIPLSLRPPMIIQIGEPSKSDEKSKESELDHVDDDDCLDPEDQGMPQSLQSPTPDEYEEAGALPTRAEGETPEPSDMDAPEEKLPDPTMETSASLALPDEGDRGNETETDPADAKLKDTERYSPDAKARYSAASVLHVSSSQPADPAAMSRESPALVPSPVQQVGPASKSRESPASVLSPVQPVLDPAPKSRESPASVGPVQPLTPAPVEPNKCHVGLTSDYEEELPPEMAPSPVHRTQQRTQQRDLSLRPPQETRVVSPEFQSNQPRHESRSPVDQVLRRRSSHEVAVVKPRKEIFPVIAASPRAPFLQQILKPMQQRSTARPAGQLQHPPKQTEMPGGPPAQQNQHFNMRGLRSSQQQQPNFSPLLSQNRDPRNSSSGRSNNGQTMMQQSPSQKMGTFVSPNSGRHEQPQSLEISRQQHWMRTQPVIRELEASRQRGRPANDTSMQQGRSQQRRGNMPNPSPQRQTNQNQPQNGQGHPEENSMRSSRSRDSVRSRDSINSANAPGHQQSMPNAEWNISSRDSRPMRPMNNGMNAQQRPMQHSQQAGPRQNPLSGRPTMSRQDNCLKQMSRGSDPSNDAKMRVHRGTAQRQDEMLRRVDHKRGMRPLIAELKQAKPVGNGVEHPLQRQPVRCCTDSLPGRNMPPKNARYKNGIPIMLSFDPIRSGRSVSPYSEKDDQEMDLNEMAVRLMNYEPRDPGGRMHDQLNGGSFHQISRQVNTRRDRLSLSSHSGGDSLYFHQHAPQQLNSRQFGR